MLFGVFLTPWPYSETFPSIQSKELNKKIRKQGCREKLSEIKRASGRDPRGKTAPYCSHKDLLLPCKDTHTDTHKKISQEKAEHPPPPPKVTPLGDSGVTLSNTARKGSQALGLKGKGRHSFRKKDAFFFDTKIDHSLISN